MNYDPNPLPLEAEFPTVAAHIVALAQGRHPFIRRIVAHPGGNYIYTRQGLVRKEKGRNEPCGCGSGKKYKKCCLDRAA